MTDFVLSMQSQVSYGHVGNSAAMFALQRLGYEVLALPTAILSNHPGHGQSAGRQAEADEIRRLWRGLTALEPPPAIRALLSGYLGRPENGPVLLDIAAALQNSNGQAIWLCDPVIGDSHTGTYVADGLPEFFRDQAMPQATIVTPNQFELAYLTGRTIATEAEALAAARGILRRGPKIVVCTSVTAGLAEDRIGSLAVTADAAWLATTPRLDRVPHGGGDLFAGLFLGHLLKSETTASALTKAMATTFALMAVSNRLNLAELPLIAEQDLLIAADRGPVRLSVL